MDQQVQRYIVSNTQYFSGVEDISKPLYTGNDRIFLSRAFQLFLANRAEQALANPAGDMGRCEALQVLFSHCTVDWTTPKGEYRTGSSATVNYPTPAMCNCPISPTCPKRVGIVLDLVVTLFSGTPAKTANLCLWHGNREKYPFKVYFSCKTAFIVTLLENPHVEKALNEFTNEIKTHNYDQDSIKLIYERNKKATTCVGCGKPTYERPLFFTTIRYCSCIEGK